MNKFTYSLHTPHYTLKKVAHLNIIGFRAAVAAIKDNTLFGRPYVIAGRTGGQDIVWDVSPYALKEGIINRMPLVIAQRLVKELKIIYPDNSAYLQVNKKIEDIISRYAPVWQNDGAGNIFFDITGTRRLFGPAADCVCNVQNEINDCFKIEAAAATGTNKLVCKVASRTIRPEGLIDVRNGEEAAFLAHQDITLLPGLGTSLMRTIRVTGFREIGELAALSDGEAISLFGKKGVFLRDSALGIDNSPVAAANKGGIESRADFSQDIIDEAAIKGAITSLAENAGLQMRKNKLGARTIKICAVYADAMEALASENKKYPLVLDSEIITSAVNLFKKAAVRRIRIRSICISLENLCPLGYEADLFEPETKKQKLQEALDKIQNRYGTGKVTRGIVLMCNEKNGI